MQRIFLFPFGQTLISRIPDSQRPFKFSPLKCNGATVVYPSRLEDPLPAIFTPADTDMELYRVSADSCLEFSHILMEPSGVRFVEAPFIEQRARPGPMVLLIDDMYTCMVILY
jgi:hypothetical protein